MRHPPERNVGDRFKIGQFIGTLAMLVATAAICLTTWQPDFAQTEPGQTALGQTEMDTVEVVTHLKSNPVIYFDSDKYVVPSACLSAMLKLVSISNSKEATGFENTVLSCTVSSLHFATCFQAGQDSVF